jgi:predicted DNA-binding ribbon-helix-helix protein
MSVNPKSLANLEMGSVSRYSEPKKQRSVTITESSWVELKTIARSRGVSVSELFEQIGRKKLRILS